MEMYYPKLDKIVEVYNVFNDKTALIFDPYLAEKQNAING
jgi:hypothetical protein